MAEPASGHTVGIDLGTTFSAIAQLNPDGDPISLKNSDGKTVTPSVVLLGESGHVMVGPLPERIAHEHPDNIIEAIKRQLGRKDWFKVYQGKKLTPEFISALILKKLKQDGEKEIGPIANAVITVPYYFNDMRRKATQDAGRIAGFNVMDIINEPTAATLAYAWMKGELGRTDIVTKDRTIMVYDLGGGTFDVTVVRYSPTHFRVLATDGDVMLGGIDWTNRLVEHVCEQFKRKFSTDPIADAETKLQFTQECEMAKRQLSAKSQVPVSLYFQGKTLTLNVTRGDYERMTADLLQRTRDTTELVLQQAGVEIGTLDEVVLVGGSTHMPSVFNMLKEVTGRTPSRELNPDEAVAQGAAIHAAILEARAAGGESRIAKAVQKRLRAVEASDVNSHALGVEITNPNDRTKKMNYVMIPRNTQIPHKITQRFVTNTQNQQRISVKLMQGDASDPSACTLIGTVQITSLPPNLPAGSPLEFTYEYEANGRIIAHARELTGNQEAKAEIVRDSGLNTAGIDAYEELAREYIVE